MNVYLACTSSAQFCPLSEARHVLESFYYFKDWQVPLLAKWKNFMLDSGAFTFINTVKVGNIDWDGYIGRYIDFINTHGVNLFFELDIDKIVGLQAVESIRARLERGTGKRPIPVWHRTRGKDYFIGLCKEYDYIALGGIAIKDIRPAEYKYLRWFIDTAHEHGSKIHGLGFTVMKHLIDTPFDSVDSTSWLNGGRFGQLHTFVDGKIKLYRPANGARAKDYKDITLHNFRAWVGFQKYAESNL